ncbi:nuclear pore complex-interacting protein family member B13-like, partial [Nomascus leucogenys]|uniref:nuclear pore complex-interacting protein family member B13-like n=1 Tax=Nomascus leucogenys TaxID=61853 RepID=UPI00122D75FC
SLNLQTLPECLLVPLPPSARHHPLSVAGDMYHFFELMILGDARHLPTLFRTLPPSPVHDSLSLKTPPECLLVPLPPSAVDDFVTPETPPIECRQGPLPSSRVDDFSRQKTPPNSFSYLFPPSPGDDSLSLKTHPGVFCADFLTPETPPVECRRRHVSFLRADDFRRRKTPPNSFFVPLPPSPVHDSLSLKTPPECLLVPLPPSAVDDFVTPEDTSHRVSPGTFTIF